MKSRAFWDIETTQRYIPEGYDLYTSEVGVTILFLGHTNWRRDTQVCEIVFGVRLLVPPL
jgi:hypothetical protein